MRKFFLKNGKLIYAFSLVILLGVSSYHLLFAKRIIPGVYVGDISLSGKTYNEAYDALSQAVEENNKPLIFKDGDTIFSITPEDLELEFQVDASIQSAFKVGRKNNLFTDTKEKLAGLVKRLQIPAAYDLNDEKLNLAISKIQGEVNNFAKDATFRIEGKDLVIDKEVIGKKLETQKLYDEIIRSIASIKLSEKELPLEVDNPKVLYTELAPFLSEAKTIVFTSQKLQHNLKTWSVSPAQKLTFIEYEKDKNQLGFNQSIFKTFLEPITSMINELPRASVTTDDQDRVLSMVLTKPGLEVDIDATTEAFKDAFFNNKNISSIVTNTVDGPLDIKDYGIFSLLGEGKSKFTGSASGRIKNLTLSANRADGVLVPPGATFSLNEAIGEITAATGYDAAWIIMGTKTVLGHGGGVCQTSTTLFRAVLNSGLPIVERNPHAYRVYYYEIENPIGMDASIYQPSLDFKFKNDTTGYVLVHSEVDPANFALSFKIYGTPDGRKVEISEPVIASQSPAPAPLYQDDPTLKKGVVRQIDFSASGAKVSFTRKVTKGGEVLYNDVFNTNYQPWRAVYLVGTKN